MNQGILSILIFIFLLNPSFVAAEEVPVLVHVNREQQSDSSGNIVRSLSELVYNQISRNAVVLWDSPKKKLKISPASLLEIEKSGGASLAETTNLFIYEKLNIRRKEIEVTPIGFSFSGKNKEGGDVAFGFIDYKDVSRLLSQRACLSDANGYAGITIEQKLRYKDYGFTILQYAGTPVAQNDKAKIQGEIFNGKKIVSQDCPPITFSKSVGYSIEYVSTHEGSEFMASKQIFNALEAFFSENPEHFFNAGGDKIFSHLRQPLPIHVTKVDVRELWNKLADRSIGYSIREIVIYVNDKPLNPIPLTEIQRWKLPVGFRMLDEFIAEKQFYFVINWINDQEIKRFEALKFLKALKTAEWDKVNTFVYSGG